MEHRDEWSDFRDERKPSHAVASHSTLKYVKHLARLDQVSYMQTVNMLQAKSNLSRVVF